MDGHLATDVDGHLATDSAICSTIVAIIVSRNACDDNE